MRHVRYVPEVKGCYGPRLWVDRNDRELVEFLKLICIWGGPVNTRVMGEKYELCYELPLGTFKNDLWHMASLKLGLILEQ